MSDRRYRLDLAAGALLVSGLVVALCVLGHDPGPPGAFPVPEPRNPLGPPGAWLAEMLYDALGIAVYFLLASWFVLIVLLLLRRSWLTWLLRLAGWLLLLPCAAVLAEKLGPALPGAVTERGGMLGAWLVRFGEQQLTAAGQVLVFTAALLAGLFLALDVLLVRGLRPAWRLTRAALSFLLHGGRRRPAPLVADEPEATAEPEAAPEPPPVQTTEIGGRTIPIHHHDRVNLADDTDEDGDHRSPLSDADRFAGYELPSLALLEEPAPFPKDRHDEHLRDTAALLEKTFADFGLNVHVVGINTGPVVTQYEVSLETGLRVNKVTGLGDDLALNLKVPSVRIVAPIPGKNTVGIEVPNEHRAIVRLKEVILTASKKAAKMRIPLYLGKDTEGRPLVHDLADMPHLLLAGRTGTGKSVCLNAIILSMLMTRRPDEVKFIMIDPKQVELSDYARLPHLMHPIVTDHKKAEAILAWAVDKMEERYDLLRRARVRNIAAYNELPVDEIIRRLAPADEEERNSIPERMPFIVIIVDELAELMMVGKKEIETHVIRLAQKSRAAGIHLVVATQKPTVDVITGLIKSNLPARICFQVSSRTDSRVVLDEMGAEKLLSKGDMLFLVPGTSLLVRAQGTYVGDREIQKVVEILDSEPCYAEELLRLPVDRERGGGEGVLRHAADDDLYEAAVEIVVREGRGSVSLLQRALGIGYGRAARLIDFMAEDGVVGAYNGSNARDVLMTLDEWEELKAGKR